ncbi:hypothetical protein KR093_007751 [Drosophila rubida]|uniref:Gustatory receptor n=1 Tax=Drosophila rubida TaxID=30044 RepID=A0AAD4PKA7_9MUSC|nr:hypothetical protein KR093_007751 [Drosophila rubida]
MSGAVKMCLLLNYYYGRLMGVINFEIDVRTGRARLTKAATLYAGVVNVLFFSLFPLLMRDRIWHVFWSQMNAFHEYVFITVMMLRVSCVFVTLLSRWWQLTQIVELLAQFRQLMREQPRVVLMWRRGVISKFLAGLLTETCHMLLALYGLRGSLTLGMTVSVFAMFVLIALLNIIISQYYFALLNLHSHYALCNEELRSILRETLDLESDQRQGVADLRSCELADRIDSLARLQSELQTLIGRMTSIFGIQILCMGAIVYISLIAGLYYTFLAVKYRIVGPIFRWSNLLFFVGVASYLADLHISYAMTYYLQDQYATMRHLATQYSNFANNVDIRLMRAFESFQLQLVRDPQKLSAMGLYNMDRNIVISMASTMITHSLILIQYDIKNF